MPFDFDELKRVVVYGSGGVGKSTLLKRATIIEDSEDPGDWATRPYQPTIGVEFGVRNVLKTKYQIWDTAGAERFRTVTRGYCRGAHILTFVCDASDLSSFEETMKIFDDMAPYASPEAVVLLVNKAEVAVEGVDEASEALGAHIQSEVDKISVVYTRHIPFARVDVSLSDPPSVVIRKLGGCLGHTLGFIDKRPGCVRIPAVGYVESIQKHSKPSLIKPRGQQ